MKAILRFDLRPTLQRGVSKALLVMHTTLAATTGLTEEKIDQLRQLNHPRANSVNSGSGTFGLSNRVLLFVVLLALTVLMGFFVKIYGFSTLFRTIFN